MSPRKTHQKTAIIDSIQVSERPLTPNEVLEAASVLVPSLGIATVYRNLKVLVEQGMIKEVVLPGESTRRYERADHHHHHHFLCRSCGKVFDIHACPPGLETFAPPGFLVEDHELVIYGRCSGCVE